MLVTIMLLPPENLHERSIKNYFSLIVDKTVAVQQHQPLTELFRAIIPNDA